MSREIKFRAWNKKLKIFAPDNCSIQIQGDDAHVSFDLFDGNFDTAVWCLDDVELMQFTGLKDINGVDIYEGDIVAVNESHKLLGADFGKNRRLVQWRGLGACLDMLHVDYLDSKRKVGLTFDNGMVDSIEVIGNIYENPELLEESK